MPPVATPSRRFFYKKNMTTSDLFRLIDDRHRAFGQSIVALSEADFERSIDQKWSAGQQLQHIVLSVSPVAWAFSLPIFFLKMLFGTANRPSRSYDELVARYQTRLAEGGKAPRAFVPGNVPWAQRTQHHQKLEKNIDRLLRRAARYTEAELDTYLLPHPLLGKLTLREMLYFTAYHVQHHPPLVLGSNPTSNI
jgi:hypothetical protein